MSKIITITDEVYERLSSLKGKESFSKAILELIKKNASKKEVLRLKDTNFKLYDDFEENIEKGWKEWNKKYA